MIFQSSALTFATDVVASSTPVLVYFYAEPDDSCKSMLATIEQLAERNTAALKIAKIDFNSNPGLAQELSVTAVPTIKLFIGGRVLYTFVGEKSMPELISELSESVDGLRS
jgi:thioredoxin 1